MDFIECFETNFDVFAHFNVDCIFELAYLSVHFNHRLLGIGSALIEYSIQLAKEIRHGQCQGLLSEALLNTGLRPMVVNSIFTSYYSQRIGESFGMRTLYEIPYSTYSFMGRTLADCIGKPEHYSAKLEAMRL